MAATKKAASRPPMTEAARRLAEDRRYQALAAWIANRAAPPGTRFHEDAHSAALLGLCEAARTFDPGRGVEFRTLMTRRVCGAIKDMLRREGGGKRKGWKAPQSLSTEVNVPGRGPVELGNTIPSRYADRTALLEDTEAAEAICRDLPPKHRQVVVHYYVYASSRPRTLRQIGLAMGLSESRASQIRGEAVDMLRKSLAAG